MAFLNRAEELNKRLLDRKAEIERRIALNWHA